MKFNYKARTKEGKVETGEIQANSKEAALLLLQKYDVFVTSLEEERAAGIWLKYFVFEKKVSKKDLAVFFRQLAVMLESRVPVVQSLSSLAVQTKKIKFKEAITKIAGSVKEGVPLSEAISAYPKIFDTFYVNLVKSGEASGNISAALYYVSENLEREDDITAQIRHAMVYPLFVLAILAVVITIIMVAVMPRIIDLIKESQTEPSFSTRLTIGFYEFLQHWWWLLLVVAVLFITALVFYLSTPSGKENLSKASLKIPLISDILKKIFLSRFCGNISTLIAAGISINEALKITGKTVNNVVYKKIINQIENEVSEGEKISSVMKRYPDYFPIFVVQMVKVGEETGKLDTILKEVVNFYQKEITRSIDLLTSLIEPALIIFLGGVVAMLAVSVLSPLYSSLGNI